MDTARRGRIALWACAAVTAATPLEAQITVGPNAQVSGARPTSPHYELIAAADPGDPSRLLACSMIWPKGEAKRTTIVYTSTNRGRSWVPTLETGDFADAGDPACAYGLNGAAYYAALARTREGDRVIPVYRSDDGGRSWSLVNTIPNDFHGLDREYLVVDRTGGEYHGRLYMHASGWVRGISNDRRASDFAVLRSGNRGSSFEGPVKRASLGRRYAVGIGNGVVLSDGTFAALFGEFKEYWDEDGQSGNVVENQPGRANAWLKVITSTDGGESLEPAVIVSEWYSDWHDPRSAGSLGPSLAVDPGSAAFKDRLYAAWTDLRSGRLEILLSYSADKGKTWSPPIVVNDDPPPADPENGPDHFTPVVAVNAAGVVGVAWYDRRDHPDNQGWWLRFSASLDGGETWLPSVRVSTAPNNFDGREQLPTQAFADSGSILGLRVNVNGFFFSGGHTGGMAVGADGVFHPVWVDNRTGVAQLWTAPVRVHGAAVRNGSPKLAEFVDLTGRVVFEVESSSYDRMARTLVVEARLKNASTADTLRGPLLVRVLSARSALGSLEISNADNRIRRAGAVFDFSDLLPAGKLVPGAVSEVKRLIFRLSDVGPLRSGTGAPRGLLNLQARVLGRPTGSKSKIADAAANHNRGGARP